MVKLKNLEFLRIIGCLAIIFYHFFLYSFNDMNTYITPHNMTSCGHFAVELFFILSGIFFIINYKPDISVLEFIKRKILRLYPVLIFCFLLFYIFSFTGFVKFTFYDNILTLFCLNGTPIVLKNANMHIFWYVSSMIWVLLFCFYLLKNYSIRNVNFTIAILIFFSYAIILHLNNGNITTHNKAYLNLINIGMLRALGGIGIGYFIGNWYKENIELIKNLVLNFKQKLFITFIEFITLYFIINNLILHKPDFSNKFVFIIAFVVIICLFLIKQGFISRLLDNDWCVNLAKYTYSLYMTHYIIIDLLKGSIWKYHKDFILIHPYLNIVVPFILILFLGIFTYHFVEVPARNYINNFYTRRNEFERERERVKGTLIYAA